MTPNSRMFWNDWTRWTDLPGKASVRMGKSSLVFAFSVLTTLAAACGGNGVDYPRRFDALVPTDWILNEESGGIDGSGCSGTRCGELDRVYKLHTDVANASTQLASHLTTQGCAVQRAGNGLTADCPDVHLSVSFSTTTITIAMTRRT
jgi:hypothetical protein